LLGSKNGLDAIDKMFGGQICGFADFVKVAQGSLQLQMARGFSSICYWEWKLWCVRLELQSS
jgi:hypothetical protein